MPYTGATRRTTLKEARSLGPRWAIQEKVDGCFVRVCLNGQGRVAHVFARNERPVHPNDLRGILGAQIGRPHAELVGELEAHTEAGVRAATERGQPLVHLFDCLHDGTRSLVDRPYAARRDALWRMQSEVECAEEKQHGRTRARDGRYALERITGWRVAPIVPQSPLSQLSDAWERVKAEDLEGLCLVNLDAKAGARASKLKLKPHDTIDATVVSVSKGGCVCYWRGSYFAVGRGRHHVEPGNVVEVRHFGFYERGMMAPRFPSLVRVRRDLLI